MFQQHLTNICGSLLGEKNSVMDPDPDPVFWGHPDPVKKNDQDP